MSQLLGFNTQAVSITLIGMSTGASFFQCITPQKGQIGLQIWCGVTGIEIAGGGQSYAPASAGTSFNYMGANGSSVLLLANGSGFPLGSTFMPMTFWGAPYLWMTAVQAATLRVMYMLNEARIND